MSSNMAGWDLLLSGNYHAALLQLKVEYERRRAPGTLANVGIAYLCIGEVQDSLAVFEQCLKMRPNSAGYHIWVGVTEWLLGNFIRSVSLWESSLDCDYQDAAGGMKPALVLFYAAIAHPSAYDTEVAKRRIMQKLASPWSSSWPGPLGRYLVERLPDEAVLREAKFRVKENEVVERPEPVVLANMAEYEFVAGVKHIWMGNRTEGERHLGACAQMHRVEGVYAGCIPVSAREDG